MKAEHLSQTLILVGFALAVISFAGALISITMPLLHDSRRVAWFVTLTIGLTGIALATASRLVQRSPHEEGP